MISIWCLPNRFRPFCPRFLSSKSRSQKYTLKKLKQREEYQNEITTNPEFENEVELLSQTLMNDTKGLVSSTLTHSHKKIRENLKAAIIFRKNFNSPMESSILTWKAKEQVLHLSSVDSSEWNADIISQYFPISKEGTKKMIAKSKKEPQRMFRSLEGVIQHDSRCILRWKNILEVIVSAQFEGKIKANLSEILNEDLSITSAVETSFGQLSILSSCNHSLLENAISGLQIQLGSSNDIEGLPPIATFSHQEHEDENQQAIKPFTKQSQLPAQKEKCTRKAQPCRQKPGRKSSFKKPFKRKDVVFPCIHHRCVRSKPQAAFARHYLLVEHLRTHIQEKPFICKLCGQKFTTNQNLKRHNDTHTGLKSYACPECHKCFSRTSERSNCIKIHKFKDAISNLNTSVIIKDPVAKTIGNSCSRPFVCPVCSPIRDYTDGSSLRKHLRNHHPDYKRPVKISTSRRCLVTTASDTPSKTKSQQPNENINDFDIHDLSTRKVQQVEKEAEEKEEEEEGTLQHQLEVKNVFILPSGEILYNVVDPTTIPPIEYFLLNTDIDTQSHLYFLEDGPQQINNTDDDYGQPQPAHLRAVEGPLLQSEDDFSSPSFIYTAPVDLCTSAVCLTVDEGIRLGQPVPQQQFQPLTSNPYETFLCDPISSCSCGLQLPYSNTACCHHPFTVGDAHPPPLILPTSTPLLEPIMLEETALDLSALDPSIPPNDLEVDEVIDLSGPMDLSSSQHHSLWDPEPGFSFTGLLAVEEDSNDVLYRVTENGLDLRCTE